MRRAERPLKLLPKALLGAFGLLLALQVGFHHRERAAADVVFEPLDPPLSAAVYEALSLGSERLAGYLLALRLQLHDTQAGRHWSYNRLDYDHVVAWLEVISAIDARSEYPMLLASRIYTRTTDPVRLRSMIDFIERHFDIDPSLHWRRLAEASVLARHRLDDLPLALRLARKLAAQPPSVAMPRWARDFEFLILAEMNELEAAIAIIEALLGSGAIDDPDEMRFLRAKLSEFQRQLFESRQESPQVLQKNPEVR